MKSITLPIKGMHCKSCELLIEDELRNIPGVIKAKASHSKKCAVVQYTNNNLPIAALNSAIAKAGYELGMEEAKPWFSRSIDDYLDIFYILFAFGVLYVFAKIFGIGNLIDSAGGTPSSFMAIFVIGITAGLSTCMALVGGLVLSVASKFSQLHPQVTGLQKFRPHLAFNIGRVIAYFILGGVIGLLGSAFSLSSSLVGLMTVAVGLLMLVFGLQLSGLFPRLADFSFTLPSTIGARLGLGTKKSGEYSDVSSALVGALTFFLPCGFTQSMQLLAISSGSFVKGAMIMGVFALGTMPGLLGIGGITAFIKGVMAQKFYKFAGILVLIFAFINLKNGLTLSGFAAPAQATAPKKELGVTQEKPAAPAGKAVELTAGYTRSGGMQPESFTVSAGQPVTIKVTPTENGAGCMSTIMIPRLFEKPQFLQAGKTLSMTFTPKSKGTYPITCAMGIPHGTLYVN